MTDFYGNNTLGARMKRYGKISGAATKLAAQLLGDKYLGIDIERDKHAIELVESLGALKGPLMKIGQILATIPEAVPEEYAQAFQQLQSQAPPMGWSFVRRRMKTELGSDWQSKFQSFEKEAAAAASLGQVHRAIDHDGRMLACKLQYPDMSSTIEADLNQLQLLFSLYRRYDSSIDTNQIHTELSVRLIEELDYQREAKNTKMYAYMLSDEKHVRIPEVIDALSTDRLLTSTWLEGQGIFSLKEAPQKTRDTIALNLFSAWYVPLYNYGIIHGDPHPGNYSFQSDLSVNVLDFGCIRIFPSSFVGGVIDLYRALMSDDRALAVHAYETWGFKGLNNEQIDTLNIWAKFLYGPIMEDSVRPIGEITNGVYGREIAEKVHKKLRELSKESGGITVPREFVFMDRAALGLGSVFLHLKAEINWYRLFNDLIDGFDVTSLEDQQKQVLNMFRVSTH